MKFLLIILLSAVIIMLAELRFNDQYTRGYADAQKEILKTNPPSQELEMACLGLWVGDQNKKAYQKDLAR